ncbi:MAG: PhoX family phosphatase [Burkholderiales bacterium]|nr:PhoX family phosphatase [Burkholderiales bacterium]
MKGKLHPTNDETINPSCNESIHDVIDRVDGGRRRFIQTGLSASALAALGGVSSLGLVRSVEAAPIPAGNGFAGIGFESIPPSLRIAPPAAGVADRVAVPAGYKVEVLAAWGDPVTPTGAPWLENVSQDAAAQEQQFGMHCDGMHYFPFPLRGSATGSNDRGLLCVNHEYTHEAILHPDGLNASTGIPTATVTIQKVRKSQAAHGISVMEIRNAGGWAVVPNSGFGRRITANTPMRLSGPAAGHALLKSKQYAITPTGSAENGINDGFECFGTANNCAHGWTPWGTYLTCEENWNGYFGSSTGAVPASLPADVRKNFTRYGVNATGFNYFWHTVDPRFDVSVNPLETNHFGWVVEIDPFNPASVPVKRTALGRFKHESAQVAVGVADAQGLHPVAYYQGDDERNEYIYKFVCAGNWNPRNRAANRDLLDTGTLYVAKFTSTPGAGAGTFRGEWIALKPDTVALDGNPLRTNPEFAAPTDAEVQALILIKTRMAADAVGATMMDRPEWTALRTYYDGNGPAPGYGGNYGPGRPLEVYCTLTNNNRRGNTPVSSNNPNGSTGAGAANPPVDAANPRPDNDYGHIIRWREDGNAVTALGFEWDIFVLCGDTATAKTLPASYTTTNLAGVGYEGAINDVPNGSADFGAPDGLWFDNFGRMWIQTDQQGDGAGDFTNIGANTMLCADPNTKEIRRFLTGPNQCEVTGVITTPDGKTLFCGIQHPGEDANATNPKGGSNWPQSQFASNSAGVALPNGAGSRPRSSVLVITRLDGGVVGGL